MIFSELTRRAKTSGVFKWPPLFIYSVIKMALNIDVEVFM